MDRAAIREAYAEALDDGLLFHAFAASMRDYEMVLIRTAAPSRGIAPAYARWTFPLCVEAEATTAVPPAVWRRSTDDRLLDATLANSTGLQGYVWGVEQQVAYPGFRLLDRSDGARRWEAALGLPFHETLFEGNGHRVRLVHADLRIDGIEPGWSPFTAGAEWQG